MNLNNVSKEQMANASQTLSGMSDEQLKNMMKQAGILNYLGFSDSIDPNLLRKSGDLFKNMDNQQFEQMKGMASQMNLNKNQFQQPQHQNSQMSSQKQNPNLYPSIQKLKQEGNDFFKNKNYEKASEKYFEVKKQLKSILEIQDIKNTEKSQDLINLEINCRTNYVTSKALQKEYETVIVQALELDSKNGKAYYRLAESFNYKKKYSKAHTNICEALKLLPNDLNGKFFQLVQKLKEEIEQQLQNQKSNEEQLNRTQQSTNEKQGYQEPSFFNINQNDVIIQDEQFFQPNAQQSTDHQQTSFNNFKDNLNIQDQLKNIVILLSKNPEQINQATQMFKSMDSNYLAQMMKQTSGMDMSPEQIESMKKMMTPELLNTMKNIDPKIVLFLFKIQQAQKIQKKNTSSQQDSSQKQEEQQPQIDSNTILQNPDMILGMLDMIKQNPQMLKQMMGDKMPSGIFDDPKKVNILIGGLKIIFKLYRFIKKLLEFKFYILVLVLAFIFYKYLV